MASAAEQLAASINLSAFSKATELKSRIWFTLSALVIYRLGTYIPIPGIDPAILHDIFSRNAGGILGMFDMFSGGALGRMTIFALNIMPYISASIIIQLLTAVSPSLEALKKEGESGRKKLNQYTRFGTVGLAAVQSWGIAVGLEGMHAGGASAVIDPGYFFRIVTMITLTGGTVFMERAQRRILVQYPNRQQGNRMSGGESSHLPLKINTSGVIPPIFASSLLLLPATVASFEEAGGGPSMGIIGDITRYLAH